MYKKIFPLYLFIPGWLLLLSVNPAISAEQQKKAASPVSWFSVEQAISQAISRTHADRLAEYENKIVDNKNTLEQMGIAQYRISEAMRKLEGKTTQPVLIESRLYEIPEIVDLLDNGITEINARQHKDKQLYAKAVSRRVNQKIIQSVIPAYWQAAGAKAVNARVQLLIRKAKKQLEPFIYAREEKPLAQKNEILHLLEGLKRIQAQNTVTFSKLADILGIDEKEVNLLRINPRQDMSIPALDIDLTTMDTQALSLQQPANQVKPGDLQKYLLSTTPGLSYDWKALDNNNSMPWLSTGKSLAFDLYNRLNKLERFFALKEKLEEQHKTAHMIAGALITRTRLAYVQYQQSKAIYTLSNCVDSVNAQMGKLEAEILDDSVDSAIAEIRLSKLQIENTLQRFQKYAALQADFNRLRHSVSKDTLPEKLELQPVSTISQTIGTALKTHKKAVSLSSFSCFTPAHEKRMQEQKIQSLMAEKERAQKKTHAVKKKKAPVKKPVKRNLLSNNWLAKQNPRSYTLQILSHSDKDKLFSYIKKYRLGKQARVIKTSYRGKVLYGLLYGLYGDRELAYIAQFKLPDNVQDQNRILIRRISEVQKTAR